MTDREWAASPDVTAMLAFAASRDAPPGAVVPVAVLSDRKLRLFLVACCRRRWDLMTNPAYREAVEVAERFAEGDATEAQLASAERVAEAAVQGAPERYMAATGPADRHAVMSDYYTAWAALTACRPIDTLVRRKLCYGRPPDFVPLAPGDRAIHAGDGPSYLARASVEHLRDALGDRAPDRASAVGAENARQADLLRCIAGNPLGPVTAAPSWRTVDAVSLARAIDAGRAFDGLPVLADALEESGCDDPDILTHCRGSGPHARGCWVVDLLLGKS